MTVPPLFPTALALLLLAAPAGAQTAAPPVTPARAPAALDPPTLVQDELPVSLERIRRGLARDDTLTQAAAREWRPMFRVEVDGELPSFAAFIGEGESLTGPAPWGSMTHGDFLQMVTPPQARSFGASTNGDLLQVLATSLLANVALGGAVSAARTIPDIIRRGREAAARREVQRVVDEIERRREEEAARQQDEQARRQAAEAAGIVRPEAPPP